MAAPPTESKRAPRNGLAKTSASRGSEPSNDRPLTALERALLITVAYADVFDYPLTEDELYERLVVERADRPGFQKALQNIIGSYVACHDGFFCLPGRQSIIQVRRRREACSEGRWKWSVRYANWLNRIPFVRMVAASGSQAAGNAAEDSDIDLFCVVQKNRLWLARLFIVPLSRFSRVLRFRMCPNYILASDAMAVPDHNLYTAHEVMQVMPLHGDKSYAQFLAENTWARTFLPQARTDGRRAHLQPAQPFLPKRLLERLLGGRMGDAANESAYGAFVYFCRRRAERNGWDWAALRSAYHIDRYTVPEGGYAHIIRMCFSQRLAETLGPETARFDMNRLFKTNGHMAPPRYHNWDQLFAVDYGPLCTNGHHGARHA